MRTRYARLWRNSAPAFMAAFGLFCGALCHAQNDSALPRKSSPALHLPGPVLVTMFDGKLDTKDAKAGDSVTLKVKKTLKLKDLEIPSGSKVVGKVENVQSEKDGNGTATLGIQFQSVELKDKKVMPIRGLIVGIGKVHPAEGLGYMGILGRDGAGSTPGLDPNLSTGNRPVDDVGFGSSLPGVAVAEGLDKSQTSELRGDKRDIKLDSGVMVKIELFRPAPAN